MSKAFENEILINIKKLTVEQQENALTYIKSLLNQQSQNLLQFAGTIDEKSIQEMANAINTACESADKNEW